MKESREMFTASLAKTDPAFAHTRSWIVAFAQPAIDLRFQPTLPPMPCKQYNTETL